MQEPFARKWFISSVPPPSAPVVADAPGLPLKALLQTEKCADVALILATPKDRRYRLGNRLAVIRIQGQAVTDSNSRTN